MSERIRQLAVQVSEGNPGALSTMVTLFSFPECIEYLEHLLATGRTGPALWLFFNDQHRRDIRTAIRDLQEEMAYVEAHPKDGASAVTTRDGLLWRAGAALPLPEADHVARKSGFSCAEQLVRSLESKQAHAP